MLNFLVKHIIERRRIVIFFCIVISFYGLYSYYVIPKQENPDVTVAVAVVQTVYPGAAPEEVLYYVTEKLEEEIAQLDRVDNYTSSSLNSVSIITVTYDMDATIEEVEPALRQAVEDVSPSLPELADAPIVITDLVDNNQFIFALSSDVYDIDELAEFGENVRSELLETNGVSSVEVSGRHERRVVVEADYEQLALYNISIDTISQLLQAQNLSIPSGSIDYESGRINVVTPAVFEDLDDIGNVVVGGSDESLAFVKLRDVADIYFETANEFYYMQDGRDAILLTGTFESGQNPINVGNAMTQELEAAVANLPEEVIFTEVMYSPGDVENSINDFIISLLQSIGLIVIVVMVGVHLRNGIVVSAAIPFAILVTFIMMQLFAIEFHFISIAALIISLGILVDNAIVVSEAIQQNLNDGKEKIEAITDGVRQTALPMLTSTVTTIITFSVIYLVPGSIGKVAGTIPTVVIISLVASYFIAMFVIPVLAYIFFRPESEHKASREGIIKKTFLRVLSVALRFRAATLVLAVSTLMIAAILLLNVGIQFFPYSDKPTVYVNLTGEAYSVERTGEIATATSELLASHEVVESVTTAVGKGLPSFFLTAPSPPEGTATGQILLSLDEEVMGEKYDDISHVIRDLQALVDANITGASVIIKPLEYSIPTEAAITLSLMSDDTVALSEATTLLRETLIDTPGSDLVRDDSIAPEFEYEIVLDSEELSTFGLLKYDVLRQINTSIMGTVTSKYIRSGQEYDILLRSNTQDLEQLKQLPLQSSLSNTTVALGDVAEFELRSAVPEIRRYNGVRYVNVLSGVSPTFSASGIENEALEKVGAQLDELGVTVINRGESSNMLDLIGNLGITATGALILIYIVLLLQFGNFKKPFVILTSIPLSLIGCFFGLYVLGMDIQAMAILGLVSLFGIVVNNGIILVEYMEEERRGGKSVYYACIAAVKLRYRPIMMSSITTCIGLVPLIVAGDPMTAPMASVLLFGLLFSTILTIIVVPVMYSLTEPSGNHDYNP